MRKFFKSSTRSKKIFFHEVGLFTVLALIVGCLIGFMQCKPDSIDNVSGISNENKISTRTCEPGDYTITDHRITFEDTNEYHKTLEFLACASESSIADWADEIDLETPGKDFRAFWDATCDDGMTEAQYNTLKSSYAAKVKFSTNGDGDDEVAQLYPVLNEIVNMDGEFQVGSTVFKVTDDKFISITDPENLDPSEVDNETETDSTEGVFVRELFLGGCCPSAHVQTNVYQNNPKKRVRGVYYVVDMSEYYEDYIHPGRVIFFPNILVHTEATHQKRKCFVFICLWRCENVQLSHDFDITVYHDASSWGITNPIEFGDDWGPSSSCRHVADNPGLAHAWSIYPAFIPTFSFCIDEVDQVVTNSTPITPVTATYHCD